LMTRRSAAPRLRLRSGIMLDRRIPRTTVVAVRSTQCFAGACSAPTAAMPIPANALGIRFAGFAEISSWSPHMSPEPATRQEIDLLARRAGLSLTDEHLDELVQARGDRGCEPRLLQRPDSPRNIGSGNDFMVRVIDPSASESRALVPRYYKFESTLLQRGVMCEPGCTDAGRYPPYVFLRRILPWFR
jgi:hypothetical protein